MKFHFAISGLGTFLGKSPVTLRHWERKGVLVFPRVGTNRSLTLDEVKEVAGIALDRQRISEDRYYLILDAIGALRILEEEEA